MAYRQIAALPFYLVPPHKSNDSASPTCEIQDLEPTARVAGAALCARAVKDEEADETQTCVVHRGEYSIRLAHSSTQRSKASMLVKRMYSWRGYDTETSTKGITPLPKQMTFEASSSEQLCGTLTLGIDSKQALLADALYREELNTLRANDRRLCEISRLAVDPEYGSKAVLASLFHIAYIFARFVHNITDAVIEVNPRHAAFYQRKLGFRRIGDVRTCPRVNAPAVLLHVELSYMDAQISRHGGLRGTAERSFYSYFFSKLEEQSLAHQIWLRAATAQVRRVSSVRETNRLPECTSSSQPLAA
jgi:hypothetical protein